MEEAQYIDFVRTRITQLRIQKNVSEHKMSLDLDKSGSYIRSITSGAALPSLKELFHIISYFGITPTEFFEPLGTSDTLCERLCDRLKTLDENSLNKVSLFIDMITD